MTSVRYYPAVGCGLVTPRSLSQHGNIFVPSLISAAPAMAQTKQTEELRIFVFVFF